MTRRDGILLGLAAVIVAGGLLLAGDAGFGGADGKALALVRDLAPGYEPWAVPVWTPAGSLEGLLFALQAALGAGVIGWIVGYRRGRAAAHRDDAA